MSACDMGGLCCETSPCAYLAVDANAEELAALRAEIEEWRAVNDVLRINRNQPASVAVHNIAALKREVERLRGALEESANGLDEVAERTWDKRHPDECRWACEEASTMAAGYRDTARAALAHKEPGDEG